MRWQSLPFPTTPAPRGAERIVHMYLMQMSFIDTLRSARDSRVAVLHEFWTQYDARQPRVHAFFEGHDDIAFIAPHIERHLPSGFRLVAHRCEGKARVYEAFSDITNKQPNVQLVMFFVDKDVDDILGTPWPTDPRIFVTDVYSVENYVVSGDVLRKMLRDGVRLTGVAFDEDAILRQFEAGLAAYHKKVLTVMAWVVLARRLGERPNLNNLHMRALYTLGAECTLIRTPTSRLDVLATATGVRLSLGLHGPVKQTRRELSRVPAKRVVRGKYELWYFVEFWRVLLQSLADLAEEAGGKMQRKVAVTHENALRVAAPYAATPAGLGRFLQAHLGSTAPAGSSQSAVRRESLWQRVLSSLRLR